MKVKWEERQSDVEAVIAAIRESEDAFLRYNVLYRVYRDAVKGKRPVSDLMEINEEYRDGKRSCRKAFTAAVEALRAMKSKYSGDAMEFIASGVLVEIDGWNQDSVRSKYAAVWMREFCFKFYTLREMGKSLNGAAANQSKVRKIAREPFATGLTPASHPKT